MYDTMYDTQAVHPVFGAGRKAQYTSFLLKEAFEKLALELLGSEGGSGRCLLIFIIGITFHFVFIYLHKPWEEWGRLDEMH